MSELGFGLGIYCIGGFIIGAILAVPIAIAIIRQQHHEDERLAKEAARRRLAWEKDEEQAMAFAKQRLRDLHAGVAARGGADDDGSSAA